MSKKEFPTAASPQTTRVEKDFAAVLNRHGYGFQFGVIRRLHELNLAGNSKFLFQTVEFPVEVQGNGTRIDIVLTHRSNEIPPFFLIAECKRANPALSNWCFVRAPYTNRKFWAKSEPVYVEHVRIGGTMGSAAFAKPRSFVEDVYHIGLEVRSRAVGDKAGESGRAIENAATQVLRGLNGFVQTIFDNPQMLVGHSTANLLPVVFTTAKLWASAVDLSRTDLTTGNSDLEDVDFKAMPYVFYQYHLSPGIKHRFPPRDRPSDLSNMIATEYIRTIPIVSVDGMQDFTNWASNALDLDE
jgi:hypothetical protein